jgi:hypothetical protein
MAECVKCVICNVLVAADDFGCMYDAALNEDEFVPYTMCRSCSKRADAYARVWAALGLEDEG